jgi:hypothetical protein
MKGVVQKQQSPTEDMTAAQKTGYAFAFEIAAPGLGK